MVDLVLSVLPALDLFVNVRERSRNDTAVYVPPLQKCSIHPDSDSAAFPRFQPENLSILFFWIPTYRPTYTTPTLPCSRINNYGTAQCLLLSCTFSPTCKTLMFSASDNKAEVFAKHMLVAYCSKGSVGVLSFNLMHLAASKTILSCKADGSGCLSYSVRKKSEF